MSVVDLELLKQELIRDEGLRLEVYPDSLGFWTIGVGHLIPNRIPSISETEAYRILDNDIDQCVSDISAENWYLACTSDTQRRGLLNMRFQLGPKRLRTFKNSLHLIEQAKWLEAGLELRKSLWYSQTPLRAERVIRMIENG